CACACTRLATDLAGTELAQPLEGVDPRVVTVAPEDAERVAPDRRDPHRFHVGNDVELADAPLPRRLVDALCTGAARAEVEHARDALVAIVPSDAEVRGVDLRELCNLVTRPLVREHATASLPLEVQALRAGAISHREDAELRRHLTRDLLERDRR